MLVFRVEKMRKETFNKNLKMVLSLRNNNEVKNDICFFASVPVGYSCYTFFYNCTNGFISF